MTFPEQILGVPLALVEQGWRREPDQSVLDAWAGEHREHYRWESITVRDAQNKRIQICRPIIQVSSPFPAWDGGCSIYAHQGWGDGMSPTPEMVKVWRFWWVDIGNGPRVKDCEVVEYERTPERYWLGPVLPPVRQS